MAACGGQRGLTTPTVRAGGAEREKAGLENWQGVVLSTRGLSIKWTQADKTALLTGRVERTVAWELNGSYYRRTKNLRHD